VTLSFWLLVALGVAVGVLVFVNERDLERRVRERRTRGELADPPRIALIVSLEGEHPQIQESLDLLGRLEYPNHELLLAVRDAGAIPRAKLPASAKVIFAGAAPEGVSQQVHNRLTAVQAVGQLAAVVAFAPAGAQMDAGWLVALARPLRQEGAIATAGARWRVPANPGFWSVVDNLWSAGVAAPETAFAMWRSAFDDHRVGDAWKRKGLAPPRAPVTFARGALVGVPQDTSGAQWFAAVKESRRFLVALGACPAMALALGGLAGGAAGGAASLALILLAALWQAARRYSMARASLTSRAEWFRRRRMAHLAAMPLAWWMGLAAWTSSRMNGSRYNEANFKG
jgi:hypothetical protein